MPKRYRGFFMHRFRVFKKFCNFMELKFILVPLCYYTNWDNLLSQIVKVFLTFEKF